MPVVKNETGTLLLQLMQAWTWCACDSASLFFTCTSTLLQKGASEEWNGNEKKRMERKERLMHGIRYTHAVSERCVGRVMRSPVMLFLFSSLPCSAASPPVAVPRRLVLLAHGASGHANSADSDATSSSSECTLSYSTDQSQRVLSLFLLSSQ